MPPTVLQQISNFLARFAGTIEVLGRALESIGLIADAILNPGSHHVLMTDEIAIFQHLRPFIA
jgi:hypothetical protein